MSSYSFFTLLSLLSFLLLGASAQQCGWQAPGSVCADGYCCSNHGWCGTTSAYCAPGNCQSQCPPPPPPPPPPGPPTPPPPPPPPSPPIGPDDITTLINSSLFDLMLLHRNDVACPARGFYTYDAFVTAARLFPGFATTGNITTRKREIAAFLAQTSHETTGGWPTAPDGPYAWGYCFNEEVGNPGPYCVESAQWPCAPGQRYYGRGPIQISYNYNYGPCGVALGLDLLGNPGLVSSDVVVSFRSALWFWMTPQPPKPSAHDVITDNWTPSAADIAANRLPGYGVITNIINGGLECGIGPDPRVQSRIGFYMRYCDLMGISYGDNLDCYSQRPFGYGLLSNTM